MRLNDEWCALVSPGAFFPTLTAEPPVWRDIVRIYACGVLSGFLYALWIFLHVVQARTLFDILGFGFGWESLVSSIVLTPMLAGLLTVVIRLVANGRVKPTWTASIRLASFVFLVFPIIALLNPLTLISVFMAPLSGLACSILGLRILYVGLVKYMGCGRMRALVLVLAGLALALALTGYTVMMLQSQFPRI